MKRLASCFTMGKGKVVGVGDIKSSVLGLSFWEGIHTGLNFRLKKFQLE
jgi:hypothetical protein